MCSLPAQLPARGVANTAWPRSVESGYLVPLTWLLDYKWGSQQHLLETSLEDGVVQACRRDTQKQSALVE